MHAGELKESISIQAATRSTGDGGQPKIAWSTAYTKRAKILGETSKDRVERQRQDNERGRSVTIRFDANVTDRHRIVWTDLAGTSHTMQISGMLWDADRRWMYIDAVELV